MAHHDHHRALEIAPGANVATDPVCSMQVEIKESARSRDYGNATFYFCSDGCQNKFDVDPYFYASGNAQTVKTRSGHPKSSSPPGPATAGTSGRCKGFGMWCEGGIEGAFK